ncbi:MAG TPA: hypothetical protein DCG19_14890 [Cryomorphaceae bacterium]|nr:hypothetical protein [Owenweeksia sp.]MBF97694.1 hypothetical protein [Owenweeksia sp.]HAD98696.1 hypothetical protein [Cryomorphaceae bacterium]HBF21183.1 hypothetical protein [Cryomorphaceae bacterium]HCQ16839.1 hypothetical protein [Cryomorphaceae bacterium]|tara:strand:- start:4819 stop:5280 length:462 start_codon:yes stop_codon:yes gene_type:complete
MSIQFKSIVGLQSQSYFNFLSANGTARETPIHAASWLNVQEKWEIINYNDLSSTGKLCYGDVVGFRNPHFNVYLSGFPGYSAVTTMGKLQDAERLVLLDPQDPSSTAEMTVEDEFYLQQVNISKYAKVNGNGIQISVPLTTNAEATFRIIVTI